MITLNNIIYRPSLKLGDSHKLIKHSVFHSLCQYSSSENNPMFSTIQRTVINEQEDFKDLSILDVDTTGEAAQMIAAATALEYGDTQLSKDSKVKRNGRVYRIAKDCVIKSLEEFREKLLDGSIIPVLGANASDNTKPAYVRFNDVSLRGESKIRHSAMAISHEAVEDFRAYGSDPDKVISDTLLIPTIADVDREVVWKAVQLATKQKPFTLFNTNPEGRNLLVEIEMERQRIFKETGRTPDYCVCSTPVLGLLLGTGLISAFEEIEIIESELETEDGEKETHTEELIHVIPNKYISRTGIIFQGSDLLPGEEFDYYILSVKTSKDDHLAPLYLHSYQPDGSFSSLYEYCDPQSFHPAIRASMRYGLMAGPYFAKDTDKVIQADSDSFFESIAGKHPLLSFTPVIIKRNNLVKSIDQKFDKPVVQAKTKKAAK